MAVSDHNLIWVDMEMTGLIPEAHRVIEIATIVTDSNLTVLAEGPVLAIHQPPEALDAMPASSESRAIPGNEAIDEDEHARRVVRFYNPFKSLLAETIDAMPNTPILVTIHSFTPVYHGEKRDVEFGILHDSDSRLADAMLEHASAHTKLKVMRNEPYGPQDGVTHTLKQHGVENGCLNVMLEFSNALLTSDAKQKAIAEMIMALLQDVLGKLDKDAVAA